MESKSYLENPWANFWGRGGQAGDAPGHSGQAAIDLRSGGDYEPNLTHQEPKKSGIISCLFAATLFITISTMMAVLCEFLFLVYASTKGSNYLVQLDHDPFWSNFYNLLESLISWPIAISASLVLICRCKINCCSFLLITMPLFFSVGYNLLWILETSVKFNQTTPGGLRLMVRKEMDIHLAQEGLGALPPWLIRLQAEGKCCGIVSTRDWKFLWDLEALPRSCCNENRSITDLGRLCSESVLMDLTNPEVFKGSPMFNTQGCLNTPYKLNQSDMTLLMGFKILKVSCLILLLICWCVSAGSVNLLVPKTGMISQPMAQSSTVAPAESQWNLEPKKEMTREELVQRLIEIQRIEDPDEALRMSLRLPLPVNTAN